MKSKKKKAKAKLIERKVTGLTILSVLVLIFFLKMYQTFSVDLLMKDIHVLEQQKRLLISQTEELQSEVNRLSNIDRISRLAHRKFNLVSNSDKIYIINLEDGRHLRDLQESFARRRQNRKKTINLAGVQGSR